jgi:hypothetical protein
MRRYHFWIALLLIGGFASAGRGAISLASLNNPTLQTLIDMGPASVTLGQYEFSDFSFVDASTGTAYTASQIQVQASTASGFGLQLVSNWYAAGGSKVDDVIEFDVKSTSPTSAIGEISLLSNGTAPMPVPGTFTTTTLIASVPGGGTAAPVLSTYDDGYTTPVDNTKPDIDFAETSLFPQQELEVIETLTANSAAPAGLNSAGVATASVLQDSFVPVIIPEPAQPGWIFLPMAVVVATSRRRRSVSDPLSQYSGRGLG